MIIEDLRESFVKSYVWPAVRSGLLYEGRYLLGTALARPCIGEALVRTARAEGARAIGHGATGKGNDQVRFELCCRTLMPDVEVRERVRLELRRHMSQMCHIQAHGGLETLLNGKSDKMEFSCVPKYRILMCFKH